MNDFIIANLNQTITFFQGDQEVVIPVDAVIRVYEMDNYAVWHGVHFEVFADEYSLTV